MKRVPLLGLASPLLIDDFQASPIPFCSCLSKFHKYDNYDKAPYIVPSYHQSYEAVLTCHQTVLIPPLFPLIPAKHFYDCTFSKSLTYNQANLKELCNRSTLQDITNKNRHCMKYQTSQCAEGIFQMQYPICAVNFINKISRSS